MSRSRRDGRRGGGYKYKPWLKGWCGCCNVSWVMGKKTKRLPKKRDIKEQLL